MTLSHLWLRHTEPTQGRFKRCVYYSPPFLESINFLAINQLLPGYTADSHDIKRLPPTR
jgi:hypothetical protein